MNILCMGGRTVWPEVAWDLIEAFLAAEFSQADRHLRRLNKVTLLEKDWKNNSKSKRND
jgi:ribose 5-phosphate isomerase B